MFPLIHGVLSAGMRISTHPTLPTGLVCYWEMLETSGTRVDRVSGMDLVDHNTVGYSPDGLQGNAADFEKDNSEYLDHADDTTLRAGDIDVSWIIWVKPETLGVEQYVYSKYYNDVTKAEYYIILQADNTARLTVYDGSSQGYVVSSNTVDSSAWHMIFAYHDAANNEIGISVDNGTVATTAWSTGIHVDTNPLVVGALTASTGFYDGLMCSVGYWKKRLSAQEVADLWNGGAGIPY